MTSRNRESRHEQSQSPRDNARRRSIPKGLRPPAQGCEERATLGHRSTNHQPQRGCGNSVFVWRSCDVGRNPVGVVVVFGRFPRVARASQPWALRHSPVGAGRHVCW